MGRRVAPRSDPVAALLTVRRLERKMQLKEVASEIGVPTNTYRDWERYGKIPGRGVLLKLAETLQIPITDLLQDAKQNGA